MLTLAVQTMWQKKLRLLLTVVGIAVCANLFIVVSSVVNFMTDDMNRQVRAFAGQLVVRTRSELGIAGAEWPPTSSSFSQSQAEEILGTEPVLAEQSAAILFDALAPPPYVSAPPEALLVGVEPGLEAAFTRDARAARGVARFTPGATDEVVLGIVSGRYLAGSADATQSIATSAGDFQVPTVGSNVEIRGQSFRVIGYIDGDTNQLYRSMVMVPLEAAQSLFNREGAVSAVLIAPQRVDQVDAIKRDIESRYPTLMAVNDRELAENASRILSTTQQFMDVVRVTAIVVAALIVMIVMFVSVLERTREIGTLRAVGASGLAILRLISAESLFVSILGGIGGIPLSVIVLKLGIRDGGALVSSMTWAQATLLLTAVGVVASLVPAYRAVRVDPLVALRYE